MRIETKNHIYTLVRIPTFWLLPVVEWGEDVASATWLWFSLDRISKEWLKFCEDHGGGMAATLEWLREDDFCSRSFNEKGILTLCMKCGKVADDECDCAGHPFAYYRRVNLHESEGHTVAQLEDVIRHCTIGEAPGELQAIFDAVNGYTPDE